MGSFPETYNDWPKHISFSFQMERTFSFLDRTETRFYLDKGQNFKGNLCHSQQSVANERQQMQFCDNEYSLANIETFGRTFISCFSTVGRSSHISLAREMFL